MLGKHCRAYRIYELERIRIYYRPYYFLFKDLQNIV